MNLLIIRHGESEANKKRVVTGHLDYELTKAGIKQAKLMTKWLNLQFKIDKIYSSTLIRAVKTAEILASKYDTDIILENNLIDFDAGQIAGMKYEDATEKNMSVPCFPHQSLFEQETEIQYRMRVENVLSKIITENEIDTTIAIVSHGGTIVQLFRAFFQLPINSNISIITGNTGICHLAYDGSNRKVYYTNKQEHLSECKA